jgi:hypothetical protein
MLCPFILNAATTADPYLPRSQLLEDLKLVRYRENWYFTDINKMTGTADIFCSGFRGWLNVFGFPSTHIAM